MGSTVRNVMTIAGRELRSYFGSPIAWVLMGFFAIIFGNFYNLYLDFFVRSATQSQFGMAQATNSKTAQCPGFMAAPLVVGLLRTGGSPASRRQSTVGEHSANSCRSASGLMTTGR